MGAEVTISGLPTMIPVDSELLGVRVVFDPAKALKNKDVIIILRVQMGRQNRFLSPKFKGRFPFFG
ncbi:MAG TPA: hypothetical protein VMW42_05850 [Desulfatiglandales bacterium]|nr:hypothetical protein [Desulfatiglandales bacterium]